MATDLGRPREARIDDAVLAATSALLAERGYAGFSLADVAERAGTSRPAIYRRWSGKAHLVHATVFPVDDTTTVRLTGDLAADVRTLVAGAAALFSSPPVRAALPGLLHEVMSDAELHERLLERFRAPVWGELSTLVDPATADVLITTIAGAVLFTMVLHGPDALDPAWVERTSALLTKGLA